MSRVSLKGMYKLLLHSRGICSSPCHSVLFKSTKQKLVCQQLFKKNLKSFHHVGNTAISSGRCCCPLDNINLTKIKNKSQHFFKKKLCKFSCNTFCIMQDLLHPYIFILKEGNFQNLSLGKRLTYWNQAKNQRLFD